MQLITAPNAPPAVGPYSQAFAPAICCSAPARSRLILSPEKSRPPTSRARLRQVLKNIEAVLRSAGLSVHHVVKATMFLQDMADFSKVNPIYETGFDGHKPARSTIQVAKLPLGALVEIEVIAEFASKVVNRDE